MKHDDLREALGAHALRQLDDPVLREQVEAHLSTCAACRAELDTLTPLAAQLKQIEPDAALPPAVIPPIELDRRVAELFSDPGTGADDGVVAAITPLRPARSRRWSVALAGAVVGAAAATTAVLTLQGLGTSDAAVLAVPDIGTTRGINASAGLVNHSWGVEVKLEMSGLEAGERYEFQVVGNDGSVRDAGQVLGVSGTTVTCSMSSSILLADAASFDVVDESGDVVVWGDITS